MFQGLPQTRRLSTSIKSEHLSSPDISPIRNNENDMSYKRDEYYSRSITQLDFAMDTSKDNIITEKSSISINDYYPIGKFNFISVTLYITFIDFHTFCYLLFFTYLISLKHCK
jgi:hypothetical protein